MNGRKEEGVVVSFDAAKGFGFIRSKSIHEDVFVHKLSVVGAGTLRPGRRVTFEVEASDRGPRASQVEVGGRGLAPGQAPAILLLLALIAATCGLHRIGLGPFGAYLVAINLATWPVYAWDKRQAGREERRVPEAVLLGLALFGGSPAGFFKRVHYGRNRNDGASTRVTNGPENSDHTRTTFEWRLAEPIPESDSAKPAPCISRCKHAVG